VVLAGGESRRFGSDKALAPFGGRTLLEHALAQMLGAGFEQVLLAWKPGRAERDQAYRQAIARVNAEGRPAVAAVEDAAAAQTPLSGLVAGLAASRHELVFACAADMPFAADGALLDALFAAARDHDVVFPVAHGEEQPLCSVWRRDPALSAARALLSQPSPPGPRALRQTLRSALLAWSDPRPFLDADTPEVLRRMSEQER
jgi:molybdopterin-guanine dinucleotide biosynthesis protein A